MELVRLGIPYEFIRDRLRMNWRDVRFGLENELLDPLAPVELAAEQVADLEHPPPMLTALAGGELTMRLIQQLANGEPPCSEAELRDRWLYLVLAWIYEQRDQYPEPLQTVEEVYADFGYPKQIADFVRYMPMVGEDLGSREANELRLFERWKLYLDEAASGYAP